MEFFDFITNIEFETNYWLARFWFLRLLGLTYFFAFLSLIKQIIPLVGEKGLTPAKDYLDYLQPRFKNKWQAMWQHPTFFWLRVSDKALRFWGWVGLLLSIILMIGYGNVFLLLALWIIYISYTHIGQTWYGYGWESQLLETGFLALFLVPLLDASPFTTFAPPIVIIWLMWWLIFRMHVGAGLIKLRGDKSWRDLTTLDYHFETQPLPNPLSPFFHHLPKFMLRFGTLMTHLVQIAVPFFLFVPGIPRIIAGIILIAFQLLLMLSGNLSFLNLITIVPMVGAFNDDFLSQFMPDFLVEKMNVASALAPQTTPHAAWIFFVAVILMSIPVIKNLFSRHQMMNTSFNQFQLVNTYGAFGTVGQTRFELIIEGTDDLEIKPKTEWKAYEFKAKPGDPNRSHPIIAPYQPRIDWQMWFAAMSSPEREPWIFPLIQKLLENDPGTLSLIKNNPFPNQPPKFIRVELYIYKMAKPFSKVKWHREKVGHWLDPLSKKDFYENS